ncbi:MAG: phage tail tape measure protein [Comamonas sp.]
MSTREMRVRYTIQLGSNVGARARMDAREFQQAGSTMRKTAESTAKGVEAVTQAQERQAHAGKKARAETARGAAEDRKAEQATTRRRRAKDQATQSTERSTRAQTQESAAMRRLGAETAAATGKVTALDRAMRRLGSGTTTIQRQIDYMRRLAASMDEVRQRQVQLNRMPVGGLGQGGPGAVAPSGPGGLRPAGRTADGPGLEERMLTNAAAGTAAYYSGKRVTMPFVTAYSNLDEALGDLRVAMLEADGTVSEEFDAIVAEAKALGEKLPGGTKDFIAAARALIEQGVPRRMIANGGLRASSYFGALMNMDQYESATTTAKVREAYGLQDRELPAMADLMQRSRYAFGIDPRDNLEVAKYAAPTYNTMKLTGLENAKQLLAVQGLGSQVGLEASSWGTNFAMMLQRTTQMDWRVNRKSKEAQEIREMLKGYGIDMRFFNDQGEFAGIVNMLQQLEKLKPLKDQEQMQVLYRLFGQEAGRPAQILVNKGLPAFRENLARMDAQANIDQRIDEKMGSFAAKLEALGGVVENVMAQMFKAAGDSMKPEIDRAAGFVGGPLQQFFEAHPKTGSAAVGAGAAAGTYAGWRGVKAVWDRMGGGGSAAPAAPAVSATGRLKGLGTAFKSFPLISAALTLLDPNTPEDYERLRAMSAREKRARNEALNRNLPVNARGQGYKDPRRLDQGPPSLDFLDLRLLPAELPPSMLKLGQATEIKMGEGRVSFDINIRDDRTTVTPSVVRQPGLFKLDMGNTNPGGYGSGGTGGKP